MIKKFKKWLLSRKIEKEASKVADGYKKDTENLSEAEKLAYDIKFLNALFPKGYWVCMHEDGNKFMSLGEKCLKCGKEQDE